MSPDTHTLLALFESTAIAKGEGILFADDTDQCSGQAAIQSVRKLVTGLGKLNIERGQTVAFLCDSSVRHILSFFACQYIGVIPCVLHSRSTVNNIAKALEWLEAELFIVDEKYKELAYEGLEIHANDVPVIILDEQKTEDTKLNYTNIIDSAAEADNLRSPGMDEPAMIILSSGTTGDPKGIVHSQKTLYASAIAGKHVFGKITADDRVIVAMAPSFAAWNHVTFPFLAYQAKIVFNRGFEANRYLKTIEREGISHAALVPTAWRRALSVISKTSDVSSLRALFFSGEPGAGDFIDAIREKLPDVEIRSAYLSSEGGDASACVANNKLLSKEKLTTGKSVPGASLRIIDPEGSINDVLKQGETGEITVKSDSIALGYWKNESLSRQRFVDGWWRSGDLGYVDDVGNLVIAGRNDNMIITGGLKVHAEEIEAALMQHPAVSLAAVVGKPDAQWGQRIEAFVVADTGTSMEEINSYCCDKSLLPSFKLPKMIHFRDNLPTGATGKIYRRGLLEELQ